jgi:hypothetical protein
MTPGYVGLPDDSFSKPRREHPTQAEKHFDPGLGHQHRPADEELQEQIWQELLSHLGSETEHVHIIAESGFVTLTGTVPHPEARASVIALVENVPGVEEVVSFLELDHLGFVERNISGNSNLNFEEGSDEH